MKWKTKETIQPKQSISSTTSMSFLTDDNLTFHRFADARLSFSNNSTPNRINSVVIDNLNTKMDGMESYQNPKKKGSRLGKRNNFSPAVWTTQTKMNGTDLDSTNEFHYISTASANPNNSTRQNNGSTTKLIVGGVDANGNPNNNSKTSNSLEGIGGDQSSKQSKCSIFRGVILCLCLNLTYANIVRFPRELDKHGTAFLVPYLILLVVIGLPIVLLEISLGQFLGQGSAHIWRASPFFKGASYIGRVASWLITIWTSMQSVLALIYIGMLSFKSVPFELCSSAKMGLNGYEAVGRSAQECLKHTFLLPVWKNPHYFGLLSIGLIFLWAICMVCTHSGKINRRSIFVFGFLTLILLTFETGWEVTKSINDQMFPRIWPFDYKTFQYSTIWFNALIQVIFSTNIGVGALPVLTGKFLYKGDAVKTSFVYVCFNLLITAISVAFYLLQFNNPITLHTTSETHILYPELTGITTIYDRALTERDPLLIKLIPSLSYLMIFLSSIITIIILIYTSTRMIRKHPNYTLCLGALVVAIAGLLCPHYVVSRILDSRIVGSLIITALIFDLISVTWIYGTKNLYTDLEFSLGRPVYKIWLFIWALTPILLGGVITWWSITHSEMDLAIKYIPRWAPVALCLAIILILACFEVGKQVDYNICSMIYGATKPSKDWGPGDPLVRHAWKQWKSVCEDTGERDFTLRRRGTKDYTNSIKKGQYSHQSTNNIKYVTNIRNTTPGGSNSYNGSVFGDSAIEEDMSIDKYSNYKSSHEKSPGVSTSSRKSSTTDSKAPIDKEFKGAAIYIRNNEVEINNYTSRIEILPQEISYKTKNPMGRNDLNHANNNKSYSDHHYTSYPQGSQLINNIPINNDHICWRKFSINSEEFSTEL